MRIGTNHCKVCQRSTHWSLRHALKNTLWAFADFLGDRSGPVSKATRGQTVSRVGPAVRITVFRCDECGRSIEV